jgi:outer membrane usher protein
MTKNTQDWNLQARLEQSREEDFSFELTLNYFWGENKNLVSQYQFQSDNERHSLRTTYSSPYINRGVQLDALVSRDELGDSQQLNADYTHERFIASVDYNRSKPENGRSRELGNIKLASAVSFVDGHWGWSRPITQAFAILTKNDDKDNIIVNPVGKDKRFESIITKNLNGVLTQLNPYTSQEIYVEPELKKALRYEENKKNIVASYKSGYVFNFEAKGDRLVKGQLIHKGEIIKLNVFTFKGVNSDTEETSFTDEEGRFWVDGIKPGKYYIQWYDWKSQPFEIKGEEFFNNVGKIKLILEEE